MTEGVIEIRGLRCRGRQGVTEAERAREQDYVVDLAVRAEVTRAIASDDLSDAIDISALAAATRAAVAERPRALVERIAADVARTLLDRFAIAEVRVKVIKPRPEGLDADAEAVELRLRR